jgi:hypothetical protein
MDPRCSQFAPDADAGGGYGRGKTRPLSLRAVGRGQQSIVSASVAMRAAISDGRPVHFLLIVFALASCQDRSHHRDQAESGVTVDIPPAAPDGRNELDAKRPATARSPGAGTKAAPPERAPARHQAVNSVRATRKPSAQVPPERLAAVSDSEAVPPVALPVEPSSRQNRAPLSGTVIAATLHRIGYSCGRVVSFDSVESAAPAGPAYRITCSSGASYRATTRNGHFVFREWKRATGE